MVKTSEPQTSKTNVTSTSQTIKTQAQKNDEYLNNNLDCSKEEFISLFNKIFGEDMVKNSEIVGFKIELI